MDDGNEAELERLDHRMGDLVREFVEDRFETETRFFVRELVEHVQKSTPSAPSSPDRMLRRLRQDGFCDYHFDRRTFMYEITAVKQ